MTFKTVFSPMRIAGACVGVLALAAPAMSQEQRPAEPEGYRMEKYRAPVPAGLQGAKVVDTAAAFALWRAKSAVFVDAMARAQKPADLPASAHWLDAPRADVPGSIWLPNTGYGALAAPVAAYFAKGLERATSGDKTRPLVFYCLAECWMSWNAAKRALTLGYTEVFWYPEGTDGWERAGHPLENREPEPLN